MAGKALYWCLGIEGAGDGDMVSGREVPEPAVRRLQTRRMPLWNAWDCFITENLVLPVMYDSVHSVLVKTAWIHSIGLIVLRIHF